MDTDTDTGGRREEEGRSSGVRSSIDASIKEAPTLIQGLYCNVSLLL